MYVTKESYDGYHEDKTLYVDDESAIRLIKNPEFHGRSKHIDTKYHYVCELYYQGFIDVKYIRTEDQVADILTEALLKP